MKKNFAGPPIGVRRDEHDRPTHIKFRYRTRLVSVESAVNMVKRKMTDGLEIYESQDGVLSVRGIKDGVNDNILDELPEE